LAKHRQKILRGHVFTAIGIPLWQDWHKFRFPWCGFLGFQTPEPEIEPAALEAQMYTDERSIRTWAPRLIYRGSPCCDRPFVVLNCAALPEDLLKNSLGHPSL
jgi:hypothetical protein